MKRQDYNYHMHTKRCGHAIGEDREYIEAAIASGFKKIGFSEHIGFKGWDDSTERIAFADIDEYINTFRGYEKEYADRIEMKLGFEFEYFDDSVEYLKEMKNRVDYMINGQHAKNRDDYYYDKMCTQEDVKVMARQMCFGMEKGITDYVAHPGYFLLSGIEYTTETNAAIREIIECAKAYKIPVEFNLKGMRYGIRKFPQGDSYIYPFIGIWEEIAKIKPDIIIGYDAHSPEQISNRDYEDTARKILAEYNLTPIEKFKF